MLRFISTTKVGVIYYTIKSSKLAADKRHSYHVLVCARIISQRVQCARGTRTAFLLAINYISVSTDCKWPFRYGERGNGAGTIARHREFAMMIGGGGGQGKGQFE